MRQTITISSRRDLGQFKRDFVELVDVVKQADGKYVLYVDTKPRQSAANSMFVSKEEFDRAVSSAMYGHPSAFSRKLSGGRFLPERLDAAYGALARAQAQKVEQERGAMKLLNRQDYIAYYYRDFSFYPKLGAKLNEIKF